ncbi:SdpI family protein [Hymenobacter edaphi]|nr:SdpI family protein [Hymenobacter edaphi]
MAAFSVLVTHAAQAGHIDNRWVLLGNYLTAMSPNYFTGIRTPWTLENPMVGQRTRRAAGLLGWRPAP